MKNGRAVSPSFSSLLKYVKYPKSHKTGGGNAIQKISGFFSSPHRRTVPIIRQGEYKNKKRVFSTYGIQMGKRKRKKERLCHALASRIKMREKHARASSQQIITSSFFSFRFYPPLPLKKSQKIKK
jgi:hypothetical protein